ncbi:uncharacterized protein IAS62_005502 [Cryptococcus decagattii]|uniref:Uncharacterized protein n=1 Tax=Cryptococcus decagattii TaxID=1859122 RepID=A0ABZ2B3V2_9TREE
MDRQLESRVLLESISKPTKLSSKDTYAHLKNFVHSLPHTPVRTQVDRLADALGVEIGAIAPEEGDRREGLREAERAAAREARRKKREEEEEQRRKAEMDSAIEGLEGDNEEDGEMENGAVGQDGEEGMDDRGDVEYGDVVDEDEDEPDNEHSAHGVDSEGDDQMDQDSD